MSEFKRRSPWSAALLTIFAIGLGQFYNGQFMRGICLFLAFQLMRLGLTGSKLLDHFSGYVLCFTIKWAFVIFVFADAVAGAKKANRIKPTLHPKRFIFMFLLLLATWGLNPLLGRLINKLYWTTKTDQEYMLPTINDKDRVMVDMRYYQENEFERGDVIAFVSPFNREEAWLRRVIALEGDTIEIRSKEVYINGEVLEEPYIQHPDPFIYPRSFSERDNFGPIVIPPSHVFAMSDNRDAGGDSRTVGPIVTDQVFGKARYIYLSKKLDRMGNRL